MGMTGPTDQAIFKPEPGTPAAVLAAHNETILTVFEQKVRQQVKSAENATHPVIINTLPAFLHNLAEALAPNFPRDLASEGSTIAQEHGGERARITSWNPNDIIVEYQVLRDTIFEILNGKVSLSEHETSIIVRSIDLAMSESMNSYFMVQQGLREEFSNTLTHDLRSPLSAIKTTGEILLRLPDRTSQSTLLAARIVENANRMDRMIQDLLDASRLKGGEKLAFEVAQCDILPLVRETVDDLSSIYGDRFVLSGQHVTGYWNREAMKRVVENLATNAIKYGDPKAPITITIESAHGRMIVSVHNHGPYIPKEQQDTLFQAFWRADTVKRANKKGWGLGLSLVRGVTEAHGGSVGVDSTPERGTAFIVDVPIDSRPFQGVPLTPSNAGT